MKKYKVIANGVEYEVLIELVSDDEAAPVQTASAQVTAPSAAAEGAVKAPLTGTVTTVSVKAGDRVKKGQVLMILEAMKMENEILAECDGTIAAVHVKQGDSVLEGADIVTIA